LDIGSETMIVRSAAIIDGFLAANPDIDPRLIVYANAARCGCVL